MDSLAGTSTVVIGAGFGGLATACYLADAGADVTVLEKNDQLGGRASTLEREGFRFDMGPSWYLMPDVFERFFDDFDRQPSDYYSLTHLDPHYRIFFKDGDRVDMSADLAAVRETFESYEAGAGAAFDQYLEKSRRNYEAGMKHFVYEDRNSLTDFLDPRLALYARGLTLLGSMQDHVERYFDHSKLQQIVQYTLVFLGGSPTNTPALYNLMSHVDFNLGVYYPEGGMAGVVDGIAELARELGVDFHTNEPVEAIEPYAREQVVKTDEANYRVDYVVSDADYAHTEQELLAPQYRQYDESYWDEQTYAPSAFLLYLGVEGDVDPLKHHTLVLPTEWQAHFDQIFEDPAWPTDPAYYICVPSDTDSSVAPSGHTNLFVLVPIAPGLNDDPSVRDWYRDLILEDLATNTGVDVRDRIVVEERFSVSEFASRYNSYAGTALGLAHTLDQTALFRPPHRSETVTGLYFTGADTTPGIGVPMCLISGELTAEYIVDDYGR